jgi:hypothetical protein
MTLFSETRVRRPNQRLRVTIWASFRGINLNGLLREKKSFIYDILHKTPATIMVVHKIQIFNHMHVTK